MKNLYNPNNIANIDADTTSQYFHIKELINQVADGLFHVGQSYEDEPAKTLKCNHCGSIEFNVGQGDYFTAIRCIRCEYEVCIHDG